MEKMMNEEKEYETEIYKKWFRTKEKQGFVSVTPWFDKDKGVAKFNIDVGESAVAGGGLKSNTNAFADAFKFASYLQSVANGSGKLNFPARKKKIQDQWKPDPDAPTDESISFYGGNNDVARVLRIHYWQTADKYDDRSFAVKVGHFKAKPGANGAIIPDMSPDGILSRDLIKITRADLVEMSYIVNIEMEKRCR